MTTPVVTVALYASLIIVTWLAPPLSPPPPHVPPISPPQAPPRAPPSSPPALPPLFPTSYQHLWYPDGPARCAGGHLKSIPCISPPETTSESISPSKIREACVLACQSECDDSTDCRFITYEPQTGHCWLKDRCEAPRSVMPHVQISLMKPDATLRGRAQRWCLLPEAHDTSPSTWNVSSEVDMSSLFIDCTDFDDDLSTWDTSSARNMSRMFQSATNFNQPLSWDTSNVVDMSYMFALASRFNQPLVTWDTSRVTDVTGMFSYALSYNGAFDWNTSSVTENGGFLYEATAFNLTCDWDLYFGSNMAIFKCE